ncbi:hypothetical protein STEG23_004475 [Scotinomys teguina]
MMGGSPLSVTPEDLTSSSLDSKGFYFTKRKNKFLPKSIPRSSEYFLVYKQTLSTFQLLLFISYDNRLDNCET